MKDSYWFRHDSNARNDEKIVDLLMDIGYEGYGIFWALIEILRDNSNYEADYKPQRLAHQLQASEDLIKQVVEGYGLFAIGEDDKFFSLSLKDRMKRLDDKREQNRENAKKRWGKEKGEDGSNINDPPPDEYNSNAIALPPQCHKNIKEENTTDMKTQKERRDSKERKENCPISIKDMKVEKALIEYFLRAHDGMDCLSLIECLFGSLTETSKHTYKDQTEFLNSLVQEFNKIYRDRKSLLYTENYYKSLLENIATHGFGFKPKLMQNPIYELLEEYSLSDVQSRYNIMEEFMQMLPNILPPIFSKSFSNELERNFPGHPLNKYFR